jgi:hypothetical protein
LVNSPHKTRTALDGPPVARLLAAKGKSAAPAYPDTSTRDKAWATAQAFVTGPSPKLLP